MRIGGCDWLRRLAVAGGVTLAAAGIGVGATATAPAHGKAKPATKRAPASPAVKRPSAASSNLATLRVAPLPTRDGSAPIERPGTEFILRIAGDRDGQQQIQSKAGAAQVAPGEYWLTGWNVTVPDAEGRRWTARGGIMGAPTLNARLPLGAGRTRKVALGAPLGVSLSPVIRGRTALFTMSFIGPLGDRCYEVNVDGKRPPHPHLTILNEKGEVVDRLRFTFGCSFICRLAWRAPEGVSGKLRAVAEVDFGPFVVPSGQGTTFEIAANASDDDPVTVGRPAPEFTLAEPETAGSLTFSTLRGKPIVLNFFCGCAWCEDVATTWAKQKLPEGTELIAVWNDAETASPASLRKFRSRTGFTGRILADPDHIATLAYNSSECPKVWVIDATGAIHHVNASRSEPADRIVGNATAALKPAAVAGADIEAN